MNRSTHAGRAISRIREIWAELDDAQRRMLEIRTGIPDLRRRSRPRIAESVDELNALYSYEDPRLVRR
jgi:hypothetical protein